MNNGIKWSPVESLEKIFELVAADVDHIRGDRAYYHQTRDYIVLPQRSQFDSSDAYYESALHELGHWTGHTSRLNRYTLTDGIAAGMYSRSYAKEELRADIFSMLMAEALRH